ncbi:MAG: DUF6434 domain-containing protein [Pseudomonadota bacterium]
MDDPTRPPFDRTMSVAEFQRWYWPKAMLEEICQELDIPRSGNKAQLRARVSDHLANRVAKIRKNRSPRGRSINWSKAALSLDTIITPDITFGRNVRGFFKDQIGPKFVCNSDFMNWVKANTGKTLSDAIEGWHALESRKADPKFRRTIAPHNNYLQYLRDFKDAFPERGIEEAKRCWDEKKIRPTTDGYVIFEDTDLRLLKNIG